MGTECLEAFELDVNVETNRYSGVIQGEGLPHRCSLATFCTHEKLLIIVAFFMGLLFSTKVFVGKFALPYVSWSTLWILPCKEQIHFTNVVFSVEFSLCNAC
jgi:hypothetical protein